MLGSLSQSALQFSIFNSIPIPNLISQPRVSFHPWRRFKDHTIFPSYWSNLYIHSALKEPRLRYAQLSVSILGYLRGNHCIYLSINNWCARSAASCDSLILSFFPSVEARVASSKHSRAMSSALCHDGVDGLAWPFAFPSATLRRQCASRPVTYPTRNT